MVVGFALVFSDKAFKASHHKVSMKMRASHHLLYTSSLLVLYTLSLITCVIVMAGEHKLVLEDLGSGKTLWAQGAKARTRLQTYKDIPLVTWTEAAEEAVLQHWNRVQHQSSCRRVLWFRPWEWGITSQLRDYTDLAIISVLTFNRTILPSKSGRSYVHWCTDAFWLECFFEPFHGDQCADKDPSGHTPKSLTELGSSTPFFHLQGKDDGNVLLRNFQTLFPNALWNSLLLSHNVLFRHPTSPNLILNATEFSSTNPQLYYELSLSALKAILSKTVFKPTPHIEAHAKALVRNLSKPSIGIHIRRTDKRKDFQRPRLFPFTGYKAILRALSRLPPPKVKTTLLVLTDDPITADELAKEIQEHVNATHFDVRLLNDIRNIFRGTNILEKYRKVGHNFIASLVHSHPSIVHRYFASVIIEAVAVGLHADHFIGMGTSGVSQLVAQFMGGRRRTEGNAVCLWQEDFLLTHS
jgi:hypothetical protein